MSFRISTISFYIGESNLLNGVVVQPFHARQQLLVHQPTATIFFTDQLVRSMNHKMLAPSKIIIREGYTRLQFYGSNASPIHKAYSPTRFNRRAIELIDTPVYRRAVDQTGSKSIAVRQAHKSPAGIAGRAGTDRYHPRCLSVRTRYFPCMNRRNDRFWSVQNAKMVQCIANRPTGLATIQYVEIKRAHRFSLAHTRICQMI